MKTRDFMTFTVRGVEPAPQGSKRHVGKGVMVESSKKVAPFRKAVADAVFREWTLTEDSRPFTEPVIVQATFYVPKPPSVRRLLPSVAPDADKLCRSLGDGLSINAQALADDALIVGWRVSKLYAAFPEDMGVRVTIRTVQNAMDYYGFVTFEEMLHWLEKHD